MTDTDMNMPTLYNPEALAALHVSLESAVKRAMAEGDYGLAAQCASATDTFQKWEKGGFQGPPPGDLEELSGIALVEISEEVADDPAEEHTKPVPTGGGSGASPEQSAPAEDGDRQMPEADDLPMFGMEEELSTSLSQEDEAFSAQLERGRRELELGQFAEAIAAFEVVADRAHDEGLRSRAQRYLSQARATQQDKVNKAIDAARKHARAHRRDLKGRRSQWEKVLALDPENQEAEEELQRLESEELEKKVRDELDELRKPLLTREKRITDVETARNQVFELREGGQLRDPDLIAEVNELYDKLDALRNDILKASEGGTSGERSGEFEGAMGVYRKAILDGLTEIVDDVYGTPVDPVAALKRTRLAYFDHLKKRVSQRYNDAKENLAAGNPEAAIRWLNEAIELLGKIEEGGDELREEVQNLLDQAKHQLAVKQEAEKLVLDAQQHEDPAAARQLLLRARQKYATYPDIDELIKSKERLVLIKIVNDVIKDIANAQGALSGRQFGEARSHCNQALSRGLNLEASSDELQVKRHEAEQLLKTIGEKEARLSDLLNKMGKIDQALEKGDLRLAARLLDQLTSEERRSPEAQARLARLGLDSDDDDRYSQAQRAFRDQNHKLVVELCEKLEDSPKYEDRARLLSSRAQARISQQEIDSLTRRGASRSQIKKLVLSLIALRGLLPEEDAFLLEEASEAIREIEKEEEKEDKHEREINAWKAMREAPKSEETESTPPLGNEQWHRWYKAYESLKKKLPTSLHGRLDQERDAGVQAWRQEALDLAEKLKWETSDDSFARAYAVLEPLYGYSLISTRDPRFQEIAQQYHADEAESLSGSKNADDLDRAVYHRREALKVAEPPASEERQALAGTIKGRALRLAYLDSLNPGPAKAMTTLQTQLAGHKSYLEEDVDVRQTLVRYAIEAEDFETAGKQTQALGYLPDQIAVARMWTRLMLVAQALAGDAAENGLDVSLRARAVDELVSIREVAAFEEYDVLQVLSDKLCDDLATEMYRTAQSATGHLSDEEVAEHIRLYSLILRLRPGDQGAQKGVDALQGRLGDLASTLSRRGRELSNSPLSSSDRLRQAEDLLAEQAAVLEAFGLVNKETSNDAQLLKNAHHQLSRQAQQWRSAGKQLEGLKKEWRKAVAETWDVSPLDDLLARMTATADQDDVMHWEERISNLRLQLEALKQFFPRLEQAWSDEKFDQIEALCDEIEMALSQAVMTLNEPDLMVPPRFISLRDTHARRTVEGIEHVRTAASKQDENKRAWKQWIQQYRQVGQQAQALMQTAEEDFKRIPPCLTKAEDNFRQASTKFEQLLTIMADKPEEVLCNVAKGYNDRLPVARLLEKFNGMIDLANQRLKEINERQPGLQKRLKRIEEFTKSRRPLAVEQNRMTLQGLVEDAESIDGCHPKVIGYRGLLNRFGGK